MRRGRPPKNEADIRSIQIGVRLTPGLHERLKAASAQANRLVSQEIELRLRLSFQEEERGAQRFGGSTNYWLFQQAAHWMSFEEERAGQRWWKELELFVLWRALIISMLDGLRPRGRIDPKRSAAAERRGRWLGAAALANLEIVLSDPRAGNLLGGRHAFAAAAPVASKLRQSAVAELAAEVAKTATIPGLRDAAKRRSRERESVKGSASRPQEKKP